MSSADDRTPRRWSVQVLLGSALALCAGAGIAWVDSRPGWDDTGVTAGAVLLAAALAAFARVPPWLAALLVAGPMLAVELSKGTGVLLAIPFAIAGAYAGAFLRRLIVGR
jgi:hypothetical protein